VSNAGAGSVDEGSGSFVGTSSVSPEQDEMIIATIKQVSSRYFFTGTSIQISLLPRGLN
jgi:hypothetical protein